MYNIIQVMTKLILIWLHYLIDNQWFFELLNSRHKIAYISSARQWLPKMGSTLQLIISVIGVCVPRAAELQRSSPGSASLINAIKWKYSCTRRRWDWCAWTCSCAAWAASSLCKSSVRFPQFQYSFNSRKARDCKSWHWHRSRASKSDITRLFDRAF